MKSLLTIAGTDPSGGAGIQVDLQVFRDFGFHGLSVVTAVVSQNTVGVRSFEAIDPVALADQIDAVVDDIPPAAIKIGMLPTADSASQLAEMLNRWSEGSRPPVVYDPVMVSGGGGARLQTRGTVEVIRQELLPRVDCVTPNVPEAEKLVGGEVDSVEAMCEAAERLLEMGPKMVLVKGGHLRSHFARGVTDVWADDGGVEILEPLDAVVDDVRGTGCQLSSALAALLEDGDLEGKEAAERARRYLNRLLHESCESIGRGRPVVVRGDGRAKSE